MTVATTDGVLTLESIIFRLSALPVEKIKERIRKFFVENSLQTMK